MLNLFRQLDQKRRKFSSNQLNQSSDIRKVVDTRIKIMICVTCIFFSIITLRLVHLQLFSTQRYQTLLAEYTAQNQSFSSPRGTIYDRDGNVLVESVSSLSFYYYPVEDISNEDEWNLAERMVDTFDLEANLITDRQLKDMYLQYLREIENNQLSVLSQRQREQYQNNELTDTELENMLLDAVDVSSFDEHTRAVYQIKMRMDANPQNQYKSVVENVSQEDVAYLSENESQFPGFRSIFDWERSYSEVGTSIRSILGNISTQTQGIPAEEQDYYLALGYELNDRVGLSGLERQYESLLSGTKSVYSIETDEDGNSYLEQIQAGKNGYDLTLTIDAEYQRSMDTLLMDTLRNWQTNPTYMNEIYLVSINPRTGDIISMSGANRNIETNEIYNNASGAYLNASRVGSIVKPAVLYMGLNEGVITPGEVIMDAPMTFRGTPIFASYRNYGAINDITAIARSSNVYMANIAIRLGGGTYRENDYLSINDDTFDLMRSYFNMFGLGDKTGIDLPNEQVGYIGDDNQMGTALYFAIGQYDSYTAMQAAQYAATLANGGTKVRPHLFARATEVNDYDTIISSYDNSTISTLLGNRSLLERSQLGMETCASEGFCQLSNSQIGVPMAAKTGTAEDEITINGRQVGVSNSSMVAYGPADNPEIAFACLAPSANSSNTNVCSQVVNAAATEYFANHRN